MVNLKTGLWSFVIAGTILLITMGCSGGQSQNPVLPNEGFEQTPEMSAAGDSMPSSDGHTSWGRYFLVVNEEDMTAEVVADRTTQSHYDVTWVKDICPTCVTAKLTNVDFGTRTFYVELHTQNPTMKIGYDVRFIVDLDGTGEYDLLDPDNYTKLHDIAGTPNPFRALAKQLTNRVYLPAQNDVAELQLYISAEHTPITYIPFLIDVSFPGRCQEPFMMDGIEINGEFPPGGGGQVTVDVVVHDSQEDHGEVWLRTGGIFTNPGEDILMDFVADLGEGAKAYRATFSNTFGGGSGLTPILIEAYTDDLGVEAYPLNDYARIFADPGGESAIAGEVFNAITTQAANGAVVNITNTGGGGNPLPYNITDGTYYVGVLAGTYHVNAVHSLYFVQETMYDVVVPPDTVVYVCFGLAPYYLDDPDEALASISGHVRDSTTGDPIVGAQATLDGGSTTGGVIQARNTDEHGHYCFWAVPTYQQDIWTVHAYHPDYIPDDLDDIPSAKDKSTPQVDFDLVPLTQNAVWEEDFEPGPSNVGTKHDWYYDSVTTQTWPGGSGVTNYHNNHRNSDILWRVYDPGANPVQCTFYVNGICSLPPDDTSDGWMPDPFGGHRYMWYGEDLDDTPGPAHSGSFIDEWTGGTGSGGTSTNSYNAGWAKTGPIDLTGYDELTLSFQSYWEIEAVDPSIQYDAMDILISTDDLHWDRLDRLNPLAEPVPDSGNAAKAYTSSGFYQAAIWSPSIIDISSYGGNDTVYLRFDFDTRDPLYNGFRGWLVDDVVIYPYAID